MTAQARRAALAIAAAKWRDAQPEDATPNDEADIEFEAALIAAGVMTPDAVIECIDYNADEIIVIFEDHMTLSVAWNGNIMKGQD